MGPKCGRYIPTYVGVPDLKEEGEEERKRKSAEQKHSSLFGF